MRQELVDAGRGATLLVHEATFESGKGGGEVGRKGARLGREYVSGVCAAAGAR